MHKNFERLQEAFNKSYNCNFNRWMRNGQMPIRWFALTFPTTEGHAPHMFRNRSGYEHEFEKGKEHNSAENLIPYAPGATPGSKGKDRAAPYPSPPQIGEPITVRGKIFERGADEAQLKQSRFKPKAKTTSKKRGPENRVYLLRSPSVTR